MLLNFCAIQSIMESQLEPVRVVITMPKDRLSPPDFFAIRIWMGRVHDLLARSLGFKSNSRPPNFAATQAKKFWTDINAESRLVLWLHESSVAARWQTSDWQQPSQTDKWRDLKITSPWTRGTPCLLNSPASDTPCLAYAEKSGGSVGRSQW